MIVEEKRPVAGIILAAGMATRFGKLKQNVEIGNRSTLLSLVVNEAAGSDLDKVVLVLGYRADEIIPCLDDVLLNEKIIIRINDQYQEGMSASIKSGLIEIRDKYPSMMIMMGDQPLVRKDIINKILHHFNSSEKGICVPVYGGRRGLPVCFSRQFYDEILSIQGDAGARSVIDNNRTEVIAVDIDDQYAHLDIDHEEDLKKIRLIMGANKDKLE